MATLELTPHQLGWLQAELEGQLEEAEEILADIRNPKIRAELNEIGFTSEDAIEQQKYINSISEILEVIKTATTKLKEE